VSFTLPQRNLGDALATLRGGGGKVMAMLPERGGTIDGRLQFVDNVVDAGSGTVRVKAEFANKEEKLWPGAFVAVRLAVQTLRDAAVIPQAAIIQSPRGQVVYVVDATMKASPRTVEVVHATGEQAAVTGVKPGERVVLEGRQNLRPGSTVIERAGTDALAARARPASGARAGSAPIAGTPSAAP
jgi:RND family efflux transporter MFP subunit